jgi:hypothetical protein
MKYDEYMDAECIPLCDALNLLPGIRTFESCCGHGNNEFLICFEADTIESLRPLLVAIDERPWRVEAHWASGGNALYFNLLGPVGAYADSRSLGLALDQTI